MHSNPSVGRALLPSHILQREEETLSEDIAKFSVFDIRNRGKLDRLSELT